MDAERKVSDKPMCEGKNLLQGVLRRLDGIENLLSNLSVAQSDNAKDTISLRHRVDLMEKDIRHSEETFEITFRRLSEDMERNHKLVSKLFDKFDAQVGEQHSDRKKMIFWLISIALSIAGTATLILFQKVFG